LLDLRDVLTDLEPLATGALDDFIDPTELQIELADGIGSAERARFDIVWTIHGDYNIHYTDDEGHDFRWDRHPNAYPNVTGEEHFHPPPDAGSTPSEVVDSCITVRDIEVVARATHKLWRDGYTNGSFDDINDARNPP
jgi:hypothetical protein